MFALIKIIDKNNFIIRNVFTDVDCTINYQDLVLVSLFGYLPFNMGKDNNLDYDETLNISKQVYFKGKINDSYTYKELVNVRYGSTSRSSYLLERVVTYSKSDLIKKLVFSKDTNKTWYDINILDNAEITDNSSVYCLELDGNGENYCFIISYLVDNNLVKITNSHMDKDYIAYVVPLSPSEALKYYKRHNLTVLNRFDYMKDDTKVIKSKYSIALEFKNSLVLVKSIRDKILPLVIHKLDGLWYLSPSDLLFYYNPSKNRFHLKHSEGRNVMISMDLAEYSDIYNDKFNSSSLMKKFNISVLRCSKKSKKDYVQDYFLDCR